MIQTADRLARTLATTPVRLADITDADAAQRPTAAGWSKKEILGHLIDAAANNHQRFVRAQLAANLTFPGYDQDAWVAAQSYSTESWPDLVNLWLLYNRHLVHVLKTMPEAALACPCTVGGNAPVALSAVIDGYVSHLEHHLSQILG